VERPRGKAGWLATLVGLLFLIAAGFTVGMAAGVAWENPGLVLAYVAGRTEDVAWSGGDAQAPAPRVAGAPAERDEPVDPQIRRERAAPAAASTPPVAAPPAGNVAVQVGAFGTSQAAEDLANSLRGKGFPVYITPGTGAAEARWRVRVGPLNTREEAEEAAARLKKVEKLPTWILKEDAD
jgi:DedD protein